MAAAVQMAVKDAIGVAVLRGLDSTSGAPHCVRESLCP
jgi:hypothetical protein